MKAMVTGASGYIGGAMMRELVEMGFEVVAVDREPANFEHALVTWHCFDLRMHGCLDEVLAREQVEVIFHFAGSALVAESVKHPEKYFSDNTSAMVNLMTSIREAKVHPIVIFSSSCAVYGIHELPITESSETLPINPYGFSKLMAETVLFSVAEVAEFSAISLRYFNVAGSWRGEHWENHDPETHVIPNIMKASASGQHFSLFGADYPTPDGTTVRDYVHVEDLISGHFAAYEFALKNPSAKEVFNLGSGDPVSTRKLANHFESRGLNLKILVENRRPGDPPSLTADISKAKRVLGFSPARSSLEKIIGDVVRFNDQN